VPAHNNDREGDNWTPLFALAEACGLEQEALNAMTSLSPTGEDDSIGAMLLNDIKGAFENRGGDKIFPQDLLDDLIALDESPWASWSRGNPLTKNSLARRLKPYNIRSTSLRVGTTTGKGYTLESFKDVFSRYLSP